MYCYEDGDFVGGFFLGICGRFVLKMRGDKHIGSVFYQNLLYEFMLVNDWCQFFSLLLFADLKQIPRGLVRKDKQKHNCLERNRYFCEPKHCQPNVLSEWVSCYLVEKVPENAGKKDAETK